MLGIHIRVNSFAKYQTRTQKQLLTVSEQGKGLNHEEINQRFLSD
jgi:hypothetical protein